MTALRFSFAFYQIHALIIKIVWCSISYYSFKIALIFYAPFDLNSAMFKLIELTSIDEVLRGLESSMTSKEIVITEKSLNKAE